MAHTKHYQFWKGIALPLTLYQACEYREKTRQNVTRKKGHLSDKRHKPNRIRSTLRGMPQAKRILIWEHTSAEERFGCSGCSWTFPNPRGVAECDHDIAIVNSRFQRHNCDSNPKEKLTPPTVKGAVYNA